VVPNRSLLCQARQRAITGAAHALAGVSGDFAELGVYRGGVARLLSLADPARTVHLFDTFTGLPWDAYAEGADKHKPGEFAASLWDVREYLSDRPNVVFHPGLFPATTAGLDGLTFALVHLDADLYASTAAGLAWFWPRLSVNGVIALDDWQWAMCPGVERAVGEFMVGRTDAETRESAPHQLTITKRT
jgi:O-methyltransferase